MTLIGSLEDDMDVLNDIIHVLHELEILDTLIKVLRLWIIDYLTMLRRLDEIRDSWVIK